ncbi:MAG: hypothetical protein AAGF11_04750 [Myxococcota bacterium]
MHRVVVATHAPYLKRQLVRATLICGPGEYPVSWGQGVQTFDRPHLRLEAPRADGAGAEVYGVGLDDFLATYSNAEVLGTYRKTTVTMARIALEPCVLQTERKGERVRVSIAVGDYLVREVDGDGEYHVPKEQFEAMYVPQEGDRSRAS